MLETTNQSKRCPVARWVIQCNLKLETAACFGGEDDEGRVDLPVNRDMTSGRFLLMGSSIAGALRSTIEDLRAGYRKTVDGYSLFGGGHTDPYGDQSPLYVFDSLGPENSASAIRDGVAIDPETGTAEDHAKFDYEVIPAGTIFPLRFELFVVKENSEQALIDELADVLRKLEEAEIPLGMKKTRGLGKCRAGAWKAMRYDMSSAAGWLKWLALPHQNPLGSQPQTHPKIQDALKASGRTTSAGTDKRCLFEISAPLSSAGSLMIRSYGSEAGDPDITHLTENGLALVPGTSIAGALRSNCHAILRTLLPNKKKECERIVEGLFGPSNQIMKAGSAEASRLKVFETAVTEGTNDLIVNRIRCDRFTGGVVEGALFDEKPVFGGTIHLTLRVEDPKPHEPGLVLLLFKDILTGKTSFGGERAIGRGFFSSSGDVTIRMVEPGNPITWTWDPRQPATPDLATTLNGLVQEFRTFLAKES